VFTDPGLRSSVVTTVILTVTVVLVSLVLGLAIALLLDRTFFGRGVVRTLMIAPFLVVPVAAALLFKHGIYNPGYGLINGVLNWLWGLFGSASAPQIDLITAHAKLAVEIELIWQWTPFMMLILLAGLQSRDPEILEAARLDGAGAWAMFRFMTLPHMRRYLELGALLGTIYIVQNFDSVFTITSGGLGTANLPYTIYQTFYQAHDYGLASAQGVVVVVASIIVATFALRVVSSLFREEV
jgi:sorbitol/mannitol transport system permease protein